MPLKKVACPKCNYEFHVGSERVCFLCKKQISKSDKRCWQRSIVTRRRSNGWNMGKSQPTARSRGFWVARVPHGIDGGVIKIFGCAGNFDMVFQSPSARKAFGNLKAISIKDAKAEALQLYKNPPKFMKVYITRNACALNAHTLKSLQK